MNDNSDSISLLLHLCTEILKSNKERAMQHSETLHSRELYIADLKTALNLEREKVRQLEMVVSVIKAVIADHDAAGVVPDWNEIRLIVQMHGAVTIETKGDSES